jgi:hypothetical protein
LNHKTENLVATEHAKVMSFISQPQTLKQIQAGLDAVAKAGAAGDTDIFKMAIKNIVPEYQPYLNWNRQSSPANAAQPSGTKPQPVSSADDPLPSTPSPIGESA